MTGCGKSHDATHEHRSGNYWVCGEEGLCPSCAASLEVERDSKGTPCPRCGQTDHGQYGEYPCRECGLPTLWGTVMSNPKDVDRAVYEEVEAERDQARTDSGLIFYMKVFSQMEAKMDDAKGAMRIAEDGMNRMGERMRKAEAERDEWKAKAEQLGFAFFDNGIQSENELRKRLAELTAERDTLRSCLEMVEWVRDETAFGGYWCPWCAKDHREKGEHALDCPHQKALGVKP
jgi:hypothetical protein